MRFSLFVLAMLVLAGQLSCGAVTPELGPVDGSYVGTNSAFEIQVTRRPEIEGPVPGAHYSFASRRVGDTAWVPIVTVRHDDGVDLPRDRIHFVDRHTAYLSMCSTYAVTCDGGATWNVWNASSASWSRGLINYGLIESVAVVADGSGTMRLNDIAVSRGGPPSATTSDFGRAWLPASTPN